MWFKRTWRVWALVSVGLALIICGLRLYDVNGFSSGLPYYWLLGCGTLLVAAYVVQRPRQVAAKLQPAKQEGVLEQDALGGAEPSRIVRKDWLVIGLLLIVFAPLYTIGVHDFPRQMSTDEIVIMDTARTLAEQQNVDIFGPSFYSDLPTFIFWAIGKIAVATGGADLAHFRLVHAMSGVLIILFSYLLLRTLRLPRPAAIAGVAAIGFCHTLFFLSRMGMRDNTATLFLIVTLLLLMIGWQRRSYVWTLLGGFMGGLTFYTYYPSRMTMVIWLSFVVASTVIGRFRNWKLAVRLAGIAVAGTIIIYAPLYLANSKHVQTDPYPDQQFLWQKQAQQQEKEYRGTKTVREAIEINIKHGLAAFNQPYADQGMMYNHTGYGFVDKITGVLLWVGVAAVVLRSIVRRRIIETDLFALVGFLTVYLSLSFLLTRAPDYTRLLIVMPFLGYMIGRASGVAASDIGQLLQRSKRLSAAARKRLLPAVPWFVTAAFVVTLAFSNGLIIRDFYHVGNAIGDGVGDTIRFQEKHNNENADWLFTYNSTYYFYWGIPDYWQFWLNFVPGPGRPPKIIPANELVTADVSTLTDGGQGYLLATSDAWESVKAAFSQQVTVLQVEPLDAAGNRVAVHFSR